MDEALPVDPWSGKFFEEFFMGRLRPVAFRLCCGNETNALDLVHDTAKWFYDWKPWEKGLSCEAWFPYTVLVMKRIHYRRIKNEPPANQLDEATEEIVGSDRASAAGKIRYMAERQSLGSKLMPLFEDDEQMQEFIYYRDFCNITRSEIATAMRLEDAREVTDLEARFTYRATPEVAIKLLGLVPRRDSV